MKVRTLSMLAGVSAPLILTGSSDAGFVGIKATSKPNDFGLLVVNVYAIFDRPGQDQMEVIGGTPNTPLLIEVHNGTFYNTPNVSTDKAPSTALISFFPSLEFDTFVTIGVKAVGTAPGAQPKDNLTIAVLWLLICGSFALRRFIRRRRGLCPACAYPMGDSNVCTECGLVLQQG